MVEVKQRFLDCSHLKPLIMGHKEDAERAAKRAAEAAQEAKDLAKKAREAADRAKKQN